MENNFELFNKAMKEYNQTKPSNSKSKEKICNHEYTIKSSGWKICVTYGLYLRRILFQDLKELCRLLCIRFAHIAILKTTGCSFQS